MNKIYGPDFQDIFINGLTYSEYTNRVERDDHLKKYHLYYNRATIPSTVQEFFTNLNYNIKAIIVGAHWCFDCQVTIPIIEKLREASSGRFDYRLFVKEENMELLDETNGGEKIPFVLLYSQDGYLIDRWIERPTKIYEFDGKLRSNLGWENKDFNREYQKGYLQNYTEFSEAIIQDLLNKFKRAHAIMSTSPRINKNLQMKPPVISI
ncbi:MAG: thioredoxin family protein [Candidatus Hodarchaeales archaeon]|jgi:hypothetical protein